MPLRIKNAKKDKKRELSQARQARMIAEWREAEARRQDRPRRRILPDEILVELARRAPSNSESLRSLRGLDSRDARRFGDEILKAIARGKSVPQHEIPEIQRRRRLEPEEEAALELATSALRALCRAARIAPPLVGNNGDVEDLIRAKAEKDPNLSNLKLASGWRGELFGDKIISFLTGRSVLRMDPQSGYPSLEDL